MQIPKDSVERRQFYEELVRLCLASRSERFEFYRALRNFYLFGTQDTSGAVYNKILSTVETLTSFVYAPDATRFSLNLGATADKAIELPKVKPLVQELNDQWRMGRSHLTFGVGLVWSLVFGSMILKGLWRRGVFRTYLVEPHQFGVLREDVPELADQEAFVHCYTTTKTQLRSDLEHHPRRDAIMEAIHRGVANAPESGALEPGVQRLILAQGISLTQGSGVGGAPEGGLTGMPPIDYNYAPTVEAELVDMLELYVWNDEINDYQMVTMVSPNIVVYDRAQPGVKGIPSFVKLATEATLYDYFWGASFVAKLSKLQNWREERTQEIRKILAKQADPPFALAGFAGIADEKLAALRSAGGIVSTSMPGAKAESYALQMPPNMFTELDNIDKMFDDQAGIGHILQGKGEPGVRSKGQADLMARLGSARPKSRALLVEEAAEDLATLAMRSIQTYSKQKYHAEQNGTVLQFTAGQFTNDFECKVDAHSSSPIFVEDRKNDAVTLFESKAIDRAALLDAFDPPGKQMLVANLAKIEAQEREQAQAQAAAQGQGAAK